MEGFEPSILLEMSPKGRAESTDIQFVSCFYDWSSRIPSTTFYGTLSIP